MIHLTSKQGVQKEIVLETLPEGTIKFWLNDMFLHFRNKYLKSRIVSTPPGQWSDPILCSEITEDEAKGIGLNAIINNL
jgi:hypothetical protein